MIQQIWDLVHRNPAACMSALTVVLTTAHHFFDRIVDAMPTPDEASTARYRFWYSFLNTLAGNKSKVTR